jgi:hypothetical protein
MDPEETPAEPVVEIYDLPDQNLYVEIHNGVEPL